MNFKCNLLNTFHNLPASLTFSGQAEKKKGIKNKYILKNNSVLEGSLPAIKLFLLIISL